ncbi:MAG TPA: alpha/beta fold hydrolase [Burkholderiales bacterium]|nr:alpha/beta fold hydrolase [Burkholderiales bacterium]
MSARAGPYAAPWWLPGGHLQTIAAALAPAPRVAFRRERWDTPDGDFVDLDWAEPAHGARGAPLLALFHGLEGSSASPYARAIAARAMAAGWRCVVPHFRGCSGELNRLPRAYHSGDSAEIGWILERLEARHAGGGAVHAAGISLGGNALLKYLGERESDAAIRKAVAISAPLDLAAAGRALDRGLPRALYTRMFLRTLKRKAFEKLRRGQIAVDAVRLRRARTLWEFDDAVTAPLHGFLGADDYWARSSSGPWLGRIRIPTLVVNARNDPFLPAAALDALGEVPRNVVLEFPQSGGHAGFPGRRRWLARRVFEFLSSP